MIPSMDDLNAIVSGFCRAPGSFLWKVRDSARSLLPFPDDTREEICKKLERPKHHFFDGLSPELKFEIFSYLSFDQLLNMRLVCPNLALLATVDTLSQLYWRSRFLLGQEADSLFPRLTETWDRCRLFSWTRASLRTRLLPLGSRKRIR